MKIATLTAAVTLTALSLSSTAQSADPSPWQQVGRQGIIHFVIVPLDQARDHEAYARQIPAICGQARTCFVNFYTNSRNVELAIPLPDEVTNESVAILRRSDKQQSEGVRWSCRLDPAQPNCF